MQFHRSLDTTSQRPTVITIGNFDGMHLGHQTLTQQAITAANQHQCESWLVSFDPHPIEFFKGKKQMRLMSWREKYNAIAAQGIQHFLALPFKHVLASMTAEDFIQDILINQLNVRCVVVGDDFRFGKKRVGDADLLRQFGRRHAFDVIEMPTHRLAGERVSTSRIRTALQHGDLSLAATLLGHPYTITGHVTYGDQIGQTLGFPTANLCLKRRPTPLSGVFATRALINNQPILGAAHIGPRLVLNDPQSVCEVHLINFTGDLYGQRIAIEFLRKIRDIEDFVSMDALREQIARDVEVVKRSIR